MAPQLSQCHPERSEWIYFLTASTSAEQQTLPRSFNQNDTGEDLQKGAPSIGFSEQQRRTGGQTVHISGTPKCRLFETMNKLT
jgi:hypothetical protein